MRSPLNVVASKSTSFETVMTVETGSYRRRRSRYASSSSGKAALSTNRCARQVQDGCRIVTVSVCEKLEPILSTCRPRLRTAEAGTLTQTRGSLPHARFSFPVTPPCDRASSCCVVLSLSFSFRCSGFGFLYSLVQLTCASKDLLHVRHPSTLSALPALTTARRSHDRPHNTSPSTEAPLPLVSFNYSSAVDRVIWLFQAHGPCGNSLM